MKWMEKSKTSLTVRMKHEDEYGMNEDSNLSHSVHASSKEDCERTTTLTDNRKRDHKNEGSSMNEGSCIGTNYAHMFPKCFRSLRTLLGFAMYFVSSIQLLSLYPFINFWPVREFLVEIHAAKTGFLRCCLYNTRRLRRQLSTVQLHQKREQKKKRESRSSEVLSKERTQRVSPFYHIALHAFSFIDPVFPDLLREIHQFCLYRKYSSYVM